MSGPPGRKVYARGAHFIWEVDGAKEKVSISFEPFLALVLTTIHSALLPESILVWQAVHRRQDSLL